MSNDPAFLFYPGDYLRDTQTLSEKTQVAYDRIMCEHMRNICISKKQLKFFTKKLSEDEIEELMFVLTETKDGFMIEWVAESINKRRAYSESRRNNRKKKNKENNTKTSKTYDIHMENEDVSENINVVKDNSFEKSEKLFLFKDLKRIIDNDTDWKNTLVKNYSEVVKMDLAEIENWISVFIKKQENKGDKSKSVSDFKRHFVYWLEIQLKNQNNGNRNNLNGKSDSDLKRAASDAVDRMFGKK